MTNSVWFNRPSLNSLNQTTVYLFLFSSVVSNSIFFLLFSTGAGKRLRSTCVSLEVRPVDEGKNVKHCGDIRVVVTRGLLQVFQRLFTQRHGHFIAALRGVLDHQVVQGSEPGWNLIASLLSCCYSTAVWGLDYRDKNEQRQT